MPHIAIPSFSPVVVLLLAGCAAAPAEREPLYEGRTEPLGAHGSCAEGDALFCGGQGAGRCFCDAECFSHGDCCDDATPLCGVPSHRLEDRTAGLTPLLGPEALEVVAELPYPPGNVAVSEDGRVFITFHPDGNRGDVKVAELVDGEARAFPSEEFQRRLESVLSLRVDRHGRLFLLDFANFGIGRPRLFAIDLATSEVVLDYRFPSSAAGFGSMLNDFQVSADGRTVFVSDPSPLAQKPAIVVVDLDRETPIARRRLEKHPTLADGPYDVFVDGEMIRARGLRPDYGIDGITLSQDGAWLYYTSLTTGELYRIPADALVYQDSGLLDPDLEPLIEHVADIPLSDGMAIDHERNVYTSSMESFAIMRVGADRRVEVLLADERLRWPDGFSWGPSGHLYVTASALHLYMPKLLRTDRAIERHAPYHVFRIRAQDACAATERCFGVSGH